MNPSSTGRLAVAVSLCGALWAATVYGPFGGQAAKLNLEFHWAQLHLDVSLDGASIDLR